MNEKTRPVQVEITAVDGTTAVAAAEPASLDLPSAYKPTPQARVGERFDLTMLVRQAMQVELDEVVPAIREGIERMQDGPRDDIAGLRADFEAYRNGTASASKARRVERTKWLVGVAFSFLLGGGAGAGIVTQLFG